MNRVDCFKTQRFFCSIGLGGGEGLEGGGGHGLGRRWGALVADSKRRLLYT